MKYFASTFSPMMLSETSNAVINQINLDDIPTELTSVVSHENTAEVLSTLLCRKIEFNRINVSLKPGDVLYCVIPGFRSNEAREFTHEEVVAAGWRSFLIEVN